MADGIAVINPGEARAKASEMVKISQELETLLNEVSRSMEEINNEDTGLYQGSNRPAELRAQLDEFRAVFNKTYEQIVKSADNIIAMANTMEAE